MADPAEALAELALGGGFQHLADDDRARARINQSGVHTDFMIGGPEVEVTGRRADGQEIPVLIGGRWKI